MYVAKDHLDLLVLLPPAGITGVHPHALFIQCWESNQGFTYARQALHQQNLALAIDFPVLDYGYFIFNSFNCV